MRTVSPNLRTASVSARCAASSPSCTSVRLPCTASLMNACSSPWLVATKVTASAVPATTATLADCIAILLRGPVPQRARRVGMCAVTDADPEPVHELAAEPCRYERERGTGEG